jgi:hypothetical protein
MGVIPPFVSVEGMSPSRIESLMPRRSPLSRFCERKPAYTAGFRSQKTKTMLLTVVVMATSLLAVPAAASDATDSNAAIPASHPLRQIVAELTGSALELPDVDAAIKLHCAPRQSDSAAAVRCEWLAGDDLDVRAWQLWRLQVRPERGDRVLVATLGADAASYTDDGVVAPAKYLFAVLGLDVEGDVIARSRLETVRLRWHDAPEIDLVPLRLTCAAAHGEGDATASAGCEWSGIEHDRASGYILWKSVDGGERTVLARVGLDTQSYRDTAIAAGHRYTYVVTAVDAEGEIIGRSRAKTVGLRPADRPDTDRAAAKRPDVERAQVRPEPAREVVVTARPTARD